MCNKAYITALILLVFIFGAPAISNAEDKEKGQVPAANVVVSEVTAGMIAPEQEFIGTIFYLEVSDVSTEVSGRVEIITFEEAERINEGEVLVKLNSDLLRKKLQASVASYEQVLSDLERERNDLERIENLFAKRIVAQKEYDDQRFQVKGLEKKSAALKAEFECLEIELEKTLIKAPFNGVIIKKHVARGEWVSPGKTVATMARDNAVDVVVEVPEDIAKYITPRMTAMVTAAGKKKRGTIIAVIPKGDIATRTFPVKIRINNADSLLEGMEARVRLPAGIKIKTLLVPRDAVLDLYGKTVVVAVINSRAVIIPTHVIGYQGLEAGINSDEISEGMEVVVKGNERLRNGQPVRIIREVK
jgi:membrane fusion protein (multidrug efflux system)